MSGGAFNYAQHQLNEIAETIELAIQQNDDTSLNQYGERRGRGYSPEVIERFRVAVKTLRQAYRMAHDIDWLLSGDTGEDTFIAGWDRGMGEQ